MALMFDHYVHPKDIPTKGITGVTAEDIEDARAKNQLIKLIAYAEVMEDGSLKYEVRPMRIIDTHPLSGVHREYNAVFVEGNAVGNLMFYGPGAGPLPTGSAVLGDVMEIAKTLL